MNRKTLGDLDKHVYCLPQVRHCSYCGWTSSHPHVCTSRSLRTSCIPKEGTIVQNVERSKRVIIELRRLGNTMRTGILTLYASGQDAELSVSVLYALPERCRIHGARLRERGPPERKRTFFFFGGIFVWRETIEADWLAALAVA